MSTDLHICVEDDISIDQALAIVNATECWDVVQNDGRLIKGMAPGTSLSIYKPGSRSAESTDSRWLVRPRISVGFRIDKEAEYRDSFGEAIAGILALVKGTSGDAIADVNSDFVLLRRLNGVTTLYGEYGLFKADDGPGTWRALFDFPHEFKKRFER